MNVKEDRKKSGLTNSCNCLVLAISFSSPSFHPSQPLFIGLGWGRRRKRYSDGLGFYPPQPFFYYRRGQIAGPGKRMIAGNRESAGGDRDTIARHVTPFVCRGFHVTLPLCPWKFGTIRSSGLSKASRAPNSPQLPRAERHRTWLSAVGPLLFFSPFNSR